MPTKTTDVRNRLIGRARAALKKAAGSNAKLSKAEAKRLPKEVARAAAKVRSRKKTVTVNDAVDEFAGTVSKVLAAVDQRGKGVLTEQEARRIFDPDLRASTLAVRAELLGAEQPPGDGPASSAAVVAALNAAMSDVSVFHESGDHGVNITVRKVPGATLQAVLARVHLDPEAPWTHGETRVVLTGAATPAAKIGAFTSFASDAMENERDDMPDVISTFVAAVKASFGGLSRVELARGEDLGAQYLIGKTADGFVAVAVQPYSDG